LINSKSAVDIPGPGNYNGGDMKAFGKGSQAFTIGEKYKEGSRKTQPGPG